jgi:hypothetical protein
MSEPEDEGDGEAGGSRRGALIALVVILLLVIAGLWLGRTLHGVSRLQDCVMAGRTNCAPLPAPPAPGGS